VKKCINFGIKSNFNYCRNFIKFKNFFTLFSLGLLLEDISKHMREAINPLETNSTFHKLYIYSTVNNLKRN
jgi:hypothetical protein